MARETSEFAKGLIERSKEHGSTITRITDLGSSYRDRYNIFTESGWVLILSDNPISDIIKPRWVRFNQIKSWEIGSDIQSEESLPHAVQEYLRVNGLSKEGWNVLKEPIVLALDVQDALKLASDLSLYLKESIKDERTNTTTSTMIIEGKIKSLALIVKEPDLVGAFKNILNRITDVHNSSGSGIVIDTYEDISQFNWEMFEAIKELSYKIK